MLVLPFQVLSTSSNCPTCTHAGNKEVHLRARINLWAEKTLKWEQESLDIIANTVTNPTCHQPAHGIRYPHLMPKWGGYTTSGLPCHMCPAISPALLFQNAYEGLPGFGIAEESTHSESVCIVLQPSLLRQSWSTLLRSSQPVHK